MSKEFNLNSIQNFLYNNKVYIIFIAIFLIYIFFSSLFIISPPEIASDYWEHIATIYSFSRNLINPNNPYIKSNEPTHLFTPYHLFWGAISKIINLHPFYLTPFIGTINLFLFFISIPNFSLFLFNEKKYSLALALTFLCFWNIPWNWSGFYSLSLLPETAIYPFWFTLAFSFIIISKIYKEIGWCKLFILSIICASLFIIHSLTAAFLLLTIIIISIKNKNYKLFLLPIISIFLSFLWPYFPIFKTIRRVEFFGYDYKIFYSILELRLAPFLFGIVGLINRQRFALNCFILFSLIYLLNYFFGSFFLARFIIFIFLFLHIGWVYLLTKRIFFIIWLVFLTYFGSYEFIISMKKVKHIYTNLAKINKTIYCVRDYFNEYRKYKFIKEEDVVAAPLEIGWILPSILPCKVIVPIHPTPFLEDYEERIKDNIALFSDTTSKEKIISILKKYDVKYLITTKEIYKEFNKVYSNKLSVFKVK